MSKTRYIRKLSRSSWTSETGNKAHSLVFLKTHGFSIPLTFILIAKAFDEYRKGSTALISDLRLEITSLPDKNYAVRSSTTAEDIPGHSFAGQFLTLTDVRGVENLLSAIKKVWDSVLNANKELYRTDPGEIRCGVIIQEMVPAKLSGVSFSVNPVTGLHETVIEAVEGAGEILVQKGITPFRWRFRGVEIIEGPADYHLIEIVRKVSSLVQLIKKYYRKDVDVEWVFDGGEIFFLQARGAGGTAKPGIWSSRMIREMLPGQIKPLVWDVNIPLVSRTFISIVAEITGPLDIRPADMVRSFHHRIYLNMETMGIIFREMGLPPDSLESMLIGAHGSHMNFRPGLRTLRHTFRIIRFVSTKMNFEKRFLKEYQELNLRFQELSRKISGCTFLTDYDQIYDDLFREAGRAVYLNIIVPLLMQMYNRQLRNKMEAMNSQYEHIDFSADFPELDEINPVLSMNRIRKKIEDLPAVIRTRIKSHEDLISFPEVSDAADEFRKLVERFGHLSDSGTDFSVRKWHEDPDLLFRIVMQTPFIKSGGQLLPFSSLPAKPLTGLYQKSGRFRVYREKISSLYIFGYGLFRSLFLGLGSEFAKNGVIERADDIFYLRISEVEHVADELKEGKKSDLSGLVTKRKGEMERTKDFVMPSVIFGDEPPACSTDNCKVLKGVGTCSGIYRGRARKVSDVTDFGSVMDGDVLIIPFSDISWTPVLVRAGAIVSESGGMLSHCSIIARELGIPALVAVDNAFSVENGSDVTVDGSNGILTVHDND